ncbi:ABC transporter substrate-binding protein [Clostridium sp. YIM B02505]|uniref:ABC transporter substrate-binding protein n=1 Tax=Clostridium yunnanense TaxID=2800325 RepID=A0ABS1EVB0_9CLOT|nr:ABC transporter substrate-binding protein [Clostridium yunnanense]MBK1813322.1 ABC transporter substrate-binding protein [Clostridium yunnanense]
MKLKKLVALALTLALTATVAIGCGSSSTNNSGGDKSANTTTKKLVLGFSQIGAESGWRTAETNSIKEIPNLDSNVELKFSDAQQKQENQIKALRSFIAQKVDVIALAPVVETGWDTVFKEAKDAKIPIILVDRGVKVSDDSLYSTFIGSDFIAEGKSAGKILTDKFGKDAKLNIVELQGTVGASAANDRQKGFADYIKDYPGYKVIKSQSGDFSRAKGKEVMEAFLKSEGKNIQAVYAHNDDMAMGAIQAIEEYGLKPGVDVAIVSIDGIKDAFQAVADRKSTGVVECNPLLGPQILQAAKDLAAGKTVDKWIKSNEGVFVGDQAKKELPNRKY